MSKPEDILEQGFELAPETTTPTAPSATETLVARLEDRFSESMSLLKRIPVTLTLEVSSVEVMLSDLLNIDDDTVIEMDKLAVNRWILRLITSCWARLKWWWSMKNMACASLNSTRMKSTTWHHETRTNPHAHTRYLITHPFSLCLRARGRYPVAECDFTR